MNTNTAAPTAGPTKLRMPPTSVMAAISPAIVTCRDSGYAKFNRNV
jgi:hypothetical protein